MPEFEGAVKPSSVEKAEHVNVSGVGVKRVLMAGFDGVNIWDATVTEDGRLKTSSSNASGVAVNPATEETLLLKATEATLLETKDLLDKLIFSMRQLTDAMSLPAFIELTTMRARVAAVIESGTVSTVSSVSNIAGVGGYQPQDMVLSQNWTAWAINCGERIS